MIKKTIFSTFLVFLLSASLCFASDELIKEVIYYSDSAETTYDEAEEKIIEDGKEYVLQDITYEILTNKNDFSETYSVEKGELPEKHEFTINGEKIELILDKSSVKNNDPIIMQKEFSDVESVPEEFGFIIDGKDYIGTLERYDTFDRGETFSVQGTYKGEEGSEYVDIGGILYPLNTDRPVFDGYQEYLKALFGMGDNYTINDAYWVTESIDNGVVTKTARYDGIRAYNDYLCEYKIEGATGQTGTYTNNGLPSAQYEIKASLIYSPVVVETKGLSTVQKAILAGVGIVALAGAITGILFAIKKKRSENE